MMSNAAVKLTPERAKYIEERVQKGAASSLDEYVNKLIDKDQREHMDYVNEHVPSHEELMRLLKEGEESGFIEYESFEAFEADIFRED